MKRYEKDFLVVRLRRLPATRLLEVQRLRGKASQAREGERVRAVAEIIGKRGTRLQLLASREISMTLAVLQRQGYHRIYKGESASKEIQVILRINLPRSSRLAVLEGLMRAGEGAFDLAIEAHERVSIHR